MVDLPSVFTGLWICLAFIGIESPFIIMFDHYDVDKRNGFTQIGASRVGRAIADQFDMRNDSIVLRTVVIFGFAFLSVSWGGLSRQPRLSLRDNHASRDRQSISF